jgi:hypothetical protein
MAYYAREGKMIRGKMIIRGRASAYAPLRRTRRRDLPRKRRLFFRRIGVLTCLGAKVSGSRRAKLALRTPFAHLCLYSSLMTGGDTCPTLYIEQHGCPTSRSLQPLGIWVFGYLRSYRGVNLAGGVILGPPKIRPARQIQATSSRRA